VTPNQPATKLISLLALLLVFACADAAPGISPGEAPVVIAHRGASGYLPEHTIAAKAMAYAQGADFIEQDLVMTRDDELLVFHDLYLDSVSNVRALFPGRAREDGHYYVVDFTLGEIRRLAISERFKVDDGEATAVFPGRFPLEKSTFRIHTFAEEIELIQGLNKSTGRSVGLYPEIKSPAFHRAQGKDISVAVLDVLASYGYSKPTDNLFLQCFDPNELMRIHEELLPAMNMNLALVQLIDTDAEFAPLLTAEGIQKISGYAAGIGPSMHLLVDPESAANDLQKSGLVEMAHAAGLKVHPFTFRREPEQIPPYATDFENLLEIFLNEIDVDGVFTDFPDLTARFIEAQK
jgi:glycerophosphoryl diester phosphodiesterase